MGPSRIFRRAHPARLPQEVILTPEAISRKSNALSSKEQNVIAQYRMID